MREAMIPESIALHMGQTINGLENENKKLKAAILDIKTRAEETLGNMSKHVDTRKSAA